MEELLRWGISETDAASASLIDAPRIVREGTVDIAQALQSFAPNDLGAMVSCLKSVGFAVRAEDLVAKLPAILAGLRATLGEDAVDAKAVLDLLGTNSF